MAEEIGLFEAIHTQRALRYIRSDAIPDSLVRRVLEAGTRAPSGGNQQRWRFEREIKQKLGIPANVDTAALRPLGYPAAQNRYGPTNRRAVEDVTFDEKWGQRWETKP